MPSLFKGPKAEVRALNALIAMSRAVNALHSTLASRRLADGLPLAQFAVLEALWHCGSMCQRDLAGKLLVSGPNVTQLIDALERKGWVRRERDKHDRRYIILHLTEAGRALIAEHFPRHAREVAELFSVLTPAEQNTLGDLAKRVGKQEKKGKRK